MIDLIEIEEVAIKDPAKTRSGDYILSQHIENEKVLILTLADGVGSKPCDWKASQMACELFIQSFQNLNGGLPEKIKHATLEANDKILFEGLPACQGMQTTFSVAVWNYGEGIIHYLNVGDSRIYVYENGKLKQKSKDEKSARLVRQKDGRPVSDSGSIVVRDVITNALGSPGLRIKVDTHKSENCKAVVLASDGFYNCKPSFKQDIIRLVDSPDMNGFMKDLIGDYKSFQSDDLSGLIVRAKQKDFDEQTLTRLIIQNKSPKLVGLAKHELSTFIFTELKAYILNLDSEEVERRLNYSEEHEIELGRKNICELISLMSKVEMHNSTIYEDLLAKLRRSKS